MNSPNLRHFWHGFAQGRGGVFVTFAMRVTAGHCFHAGHRQPSPDLRSLRCYPSPSLRSGPSQAGPILMRGRRVADCVSEARYRFQNRDLAVESAAITTNQRGSFPCASRLSSSPFFPRPWPAACRILHRAAWLVPPLARLSPMPWTKTCWPVPRLADLPVSRPAASRSACRPVTRATDHHRLRADQTTFRDHPGRTPGWSFSLRLMGEADV